MPLFTTKQASKFISAIALTFAFANVAHATLVDWTANLRFTSRQAAQQSYDNTLTGTFTYDADTGVVSNDNLILSYQAIINVARRDYRMAYTPNFFWAGCW